MLTGTGLEVMSVWPFFLHIDTGNTNTCSASCSVCYRMHRNTGVLQPYTMIAIQVSAIITPMLHKPGVCVRTCVRARVRACVYVAETVAVRHVV